MIAGVATEDNAVRSRAAIDVAPTAKFVVSSNLSVLDDLTMTEVDPCTNFSSSVPVA